MQEIEEKNQLVLCPVLRDNPAHVHTAIIPIVDRNLFSLFGIEDPRAPTQPTADGKEDLRSHPMMLTIVKTVNRGTAVWLRGIHGLRDANARGHLQYCPVEPLLSALAFSGVVPSNESDRIALAMLKVLPPETLVYFLWE